MKINELAITFSDARIKKIIKRAGVNFRKAVPVKPRWAMYGLLWAIFAAGTINAVFAAMANDALFHVKDQCERIGHVDEGLLFGFTKEVFNCHDGVRFYYEIFGTDFDAFVENAKARGHD